MSRRNGAGNALDRARAVLSETQARLGVLATERDTALLRGTDDDVSRVDAAVEATEKLLRTHADRVTLLEVEAQREASARHAKEHAALIERVEKKLEARAAAVERLAACVVAADAAFLDVLALNRAILAAWGWQNGDLGAAMLTDTVVVGALRNELFRTAGRPPSTGGQPGDARGPSWPGGAPERLEWIAMPAKSAAPLTEKFAAATRAAIAIMRTGHNAPAPVTNGAVHSAMNASSPNEQPAPSSPGPSEFPQKGGPEMLALLERQNILVNGPMHDAADREYELNSARIRELVELGEGASQ